MKIHKLLICSFLAAAALTANAENRAKYVFYFIGDGMGMGPVMAAQTYHRMVRGSETPLTMMQMPVVGWCQTYSASSPVTDSAAAGTALSTGTKTRNSMLGMSPDTLAVNSVARILQNEGYGIGVVTSVAPDDATPGAFYAHVPHRSMYYQIGCQMAESGYEFIAGGGLRGLKDKQGNPTDLLERFAENEVQIVRGPSEIETIDSRKVLLLNPDGTPEWNIGYTIDSIGSSVLSLPQITASCLAHLEKHSPDSFFMMVEGGNIDHALHANDGGAAIKETLNFDEAIALAYNFYKAHPDETLIVVTADHDTGGMAMGNRTIKYDAHLELFDAQRVSKEAFSEYCKKIIDSGKPYSWEQMKDYLKKNLGFFTTVKVTPEQEAGLKAKFEAAVDRHSEADQQTLYASFNAFAVDVFSLLNNAAGVGFTTTSHSGNPVPVFAVGVGADSFKGFNNNSSLPALILKATGR